MSHGQSVSADYVPGSTGGQVPLIERLRKKLEEQDRRVSVLHMYRHVGLYACGRYVLVALCGEDDGVESGAKAEATRAARATRGGGHAAWGAPSRGVRRCGCAPTLRPFDLPLPLYVERVRGRVLIMDRYFYDTLVDVAAGGACAARVCSRSSRPRRTSPSISTSAPSRLTRARATTPWPTSAGAAMHIAVSSPPGVAGSSSTPGATPTPRCTPWSRSCAKGWRRVDERV